jgi:hypothetical protein
MRIIRMAYIQLAANEWGNETMSRVANEYFASHADIDVIEISEHGGWYLTYLRDGTIVGTANDIARLSDTARQWIDKAKADKADFATIAHIRR